MMLGKDGFARRHSTGEGRFPVAGALASPLGRLRGRATTPKGPNQQSGCETVEMA
jgi:hypothetical protein